MAAPKGNKNRLKDGRTDVISVRISPALNRAMNAIAAREGGETKSDLVNRAVRRLILIEYPDVAGAELSGDHLK